MTSLVGLYREVELSPGRHRSNDAQLLEQVGAALRTAGFSVDLMTLADAQLCGAVTDAALVFSMCQGPSALQQLSVWEQDGSRVVNSPRAALNTYRDRLPSIMRSAGIPFPATTVIATRAAIGAEHDVNGGIWLKRGDVHASVKADVQWIGSSVQLSAGLEEFASRGIRHAVLQPHTPGDEIKFYGVVGNRFFHWFYTSGKSRWPIDPAALERLAEAAAGAAGLEIFGGDVIVSPSGELTLIDLNDWPSFAPCREAAAEAIALFIARRVDGVRNTDLVSSANPRAL